MIRYNTKRYWGYSTDTKPINAQIGDRFLVMDTQLEYVFSDYNKWELIGSNASNFTGGTVSGATIFTNGLTANTISATTYQNLPATPFLPLSGGTVTGATIFTDGLTANTISATTYYNLPKDIFVTGGTYTSGNAIFTNNSGGTFTVSGFPIGSGGGQIFYLNLSQSQNGNRLLSTTASTASEQSTGVTINNGVTSTIASFQSQPLNTTLLPGGIWSFYLHSYKENTNASFNIFVELYKITSGGTQTLLFTTDPTPVTTNSPNPSMQLTDGYFSGTPLSVSDGVVAVVRATNTDNQPHIITFVTEGNTHYSYVVSTIPTQQGLTCDTLSGCSIIQTIQTDVSNKLDKSGGTITGNLIINSGLTATTISATTYQNLPTDVRVTGSTYSNNTFTYTNNTGGTFSVLFNTVTGLTVNGNLTVTGTTTSTTISATTYQNLPTDIRVTGATYSNNTFTYTNNTGGTFNVLFNTVTGLTVNGNLTVTGTTTSTTISATTYQNLPATPFLPLSGGTVTGATSFTNGLTANTISATTFTSSTETIIGRIPTSATGSVLTDLTPYSVYVQGIYVYVVNYNSNSLQIFDVSNPSSPVLVGTVSTGLVPLNVYVQGKYAYVVNSSSNTLQIFDVSNPSSPVSVGTISTDTNPRSIYVQGRYVYIGNFSSNTLQIFDVSNPSSPVLVGTVSTGLGVIGVYVQGRYAYVVNSNSNSLQIFDVSNPSSPISVGTVSTSSNPFGIYVQGKYAYVANSVLQIFDVSNPSSPVSVGTTSSGISSVHVQGRYAYVVNSSSNTLRIINVSNPSSPVSVGTVSTGGGPNDVYVQGRYAYVVNFGSNTLQIFDVGGSYIQQLEAGGILTNTLESVGNATIGNDLAVVGGLNVSQSVNILGNLSATNMRVVSGLTANTISATTYFNLPTDIRVTGATKSGDVATFTNNTGGTFTLTGLTDTFVTGGTYSGSTIIFTNNTGGTFNVTGITTSSAFTGGTVTGATIFTGGLTADTISATTITSPSISPYGLIVATSIGYQNIF